MSMKSKAQWWETSFGDNYLKTYLDITTSDVTKLEIEFILKFLGPTLESRILDLACGVGRHAIQLADYGIDVTGVEFSPMFVELARIEARRLNIAATFIEADMREFCCIDAFDYALSMFTSFGYFDDADNSRVLHNISKSLRSGGALLIDLNNFARTLDVMLRHRETYRTITTLRTKPYINTLSNGLVVTTTEEFAPESMRWSITRSWSEQGKKQKYSTSVRMYSFPEMKSLLRQAGMGVERLWGGFDGSDFAFDSSRLIILARKP